MNQIKAIGDSILLKYRSNLGIDPGLYLEEGLSAGEIKAFLKEKYNLEAPGFLIDLYSWHNGNKGEIELPIKKYCFVPPTYFLGLEYAAMYYKINIDEGEWDKSFFPIFDFHGDFILVDIDKGSKTYGHLFNFYCTAGSFPYYENRSHKSIVALFQWVSLCLDNGAIYLNEEGFVRTKDNKAAEIALRGDKDIKDLFNVSSRLLNPLLPPGYDEDE